VATNKEYLINADNFFPNVEAQRSNTLPAGAYTCKITMEGAPYLSPIKIMTDTIINIPNTFTEDVIGEIRQFWSNNVSEKFKTYGLIHKRGVLLAGRPGTGKTLTLAKAAQIVIEEFNGAVLFNPEPKYVAEFIKLIKDIEPDKKVMIMWEEFDSFLQSYESELLSLLDGELQVGNIIFLATTNYISKIPSRIKNRPSRFARIIEVTDPSTEARRAFLEAKLVGDDRSHLEAMVEATEGFVIDQLKDLIISVCCFGYSISDAIMKIKEMQDDSMGMEF
jgi:SpoVK/Ycf46/Vps4 family AAA+-type ATPase